MKFWFVLSCIAAFAHMQSFSRMVSIKKSKGRRFVLFLGFIFLCSMVIFIGDPVNIIPTIFLFAGTVFFACDGIWLKKLTLSLMFASMSFAVNAIFDNYIGYYGRLHPGHYRLVFYLLFFFWMRGHAPAKDYELTPFLWKLLLMLTATPFCIVLILVVFRDSSYFRWRNGSYLSDGLLLLLAAVSFIGLLWTVTVLAKQRELEEEQKFYEINQSYYESMERQQLEIRRLRHDMANHLQILVGLSGKERDAYLKELIEMPILKGSLHFCEHPVVNAVLCTKMPWIEDQGIRIAVDIRIPEQLGIGNTDLCALFADSLDNAVEACGKLPEKERRIGIKAKAEKGLLVYQIKNPVAKCGAFAESRVSAECGASAKSGVSAEGGASAERKAAAGWLPGTTKKDKKNHGLGLQSIREIVKRYQGHMEITRENGEFCLFLYLPLPA